MTYDIWSDREGPIRHLTKRPPRFDRASGTVTFEQDPSVKGTANHLVAAVSLVGFIEREFTPNVRVIFRDRRGREFDEGVASSGRTEVAFGSRRFYRFERPTGLQTEYPSAYISAESVTEIIDGP
jgi:hypothetical protein